MIWENFKMALRSLRGAKLRSFLTMLGIIIGVASVTTIIAIGQGVKVEVAKQINSFGANSVFITPGQLITTDKNGKTSLNPSAGAGTTTLTSQDVDSVKKLAHITSVAPISLFSGLISQGASQDPSALLLATTPSFNEIQKQTLAAGRFLKTTDTTQDVVVLGSKAAASLFGDHAAVGQTVTIRTTPFKVVGVFAASPNTGFNFGPSLDDAVYIPENSAVKLTKSPLQILRIVVEVDSASSVNPAVSSLKQQLLKNHGGQEDFSVLKQSDIISATGQILNLLTTFIVAIASIALLVGGIGIMNIMLVSVTERTREIGIRKAIGASASIIMLQFLIEAVVISFIGGLLGLGLSLVQGQLAEKFAKIHPVYTLGAILLAFGVSTLIGVVFGIAPAIKAARKRPIQALRYE